MSDCIFCKIVNGEIPCSKIYEDEDVLAFLDVSPVHSGHSLVIPKKHYETLMDIPDDLLQKVSVVIKKVSKAVYDGVNADGINIAQNNYKAAAQIVPHLHFHVIPRFSGDGLKTWPQGDYEEGQIEKVKEMIVIRLKRESLNRTQKDQNPAMPM